MGFFTEWPRNGARLRQDRRNPFQGGMGFFTGNLPYVSFSLSSYGSQSLSGWDGVFHDKSWAFVEVGFELSQSLSGWDGVFHPEKGLRAKEGKMKVAIPFRVGWGFSRSKEKMIVEMPVTCRNPFQGGMGFFTPRQIPGGGGTGSESQSLSGWDGVFHQVSLA